MELCKFTAGFIARGVRIDDFFTIVVLLEVARLFFSNLANLICLDCPNVGGKKPRLTIIISDFSIKFLMIPIKHHIEQFYSFCKNSLLLIPALFSIKDSIALISLGARKERTL